MATRVKHVVFYPHPREAVWTALTDRHALAEWLMPNDFEPVVGHKFRFQTDAQPLCGSGLTHCEVLEIDPPHRLVYSWQHVPLKSTKPLPPVTTVTWLLEDAPGGTRLTLEHSGFQGFGMWLTSRLMRVGWGYMLRKLVPRVLGNVSGGAFTPGAVPLEKRTYTCKHIAPELTTSSRS
jgi:uncharacterized protein YndB with AHSA1/START domain